jgi:hypothetical protein
VWAHWSPGLGGVRMLGHARLLFAPGPDSPIFDITDLFKCGVSVHIVAVGACVLFPVA